MKRLIAVALLFASCTTEVPGAKCLSHEECASRFCDDGVCHACVLDNDCPSGTCDDGVCGGLPPSGAGVVGVAPTDIDFGAPLLDVAQSRPLRVRNSGSQSFTVQTLPLSAPFSVSPPRATIAPGGESLFTISYTNDDDQADSDTLVLQTDAGACDSSCADPRTIEVALHSAFSGGAPVLSLAPSDHDFGSAPVGGQSSEQALVLGNASQGDTIVRVDSIAKTGDVDAFTLTVPSTPLYIAPGQSISLPVTFAPQTAGEFQMVFRAGAQTATFHGRTGGSLAFSPPQLGFGTAAAQQSAELVNLSAVAQQVDALTVSDPTFAVHAAFALPYNIAPSESLTVFVDYPGGGQSAEVRARYGSEEARLQVDGDVPAAGFSSAEVIAGPTTNPLITSCACQATAQVPAANVDLSVRSGQGECAKPANPTCGVTGSCPCAAMPGASWNAARSEEVRGETWIVDERITLASGVDGVYDVHVTLVDDCLAVPGSTSLAVNHACCLLDCQGDRQCFPFSETPICTAECDFFAGTSTSHDCLGRGPIAIETQVTLSGSAGSESHRYCTVLPASGSTASVVSMTRTAGLLTLGSVAAGSRALAVGEACH